MNDKEINFRLDAACNEVTSAEMKNALHACRPGHPLNKTIKRPFYNAYFMAIGQRSISYQTEEWLRKMVEKE